MALVSIPSTNCFSATPPLEGKVRLPRTNNKPGTVTCRIGKIDEVRPKTFFGRKSFPPGFTFGAASSAYQIEGGVEERGPNIWDTFSHTPNTIDDGQTGDVACDSYHRYKEDVQQLKDMGMDAYRFSISWSRILPKGNIEGGISQEGIDYYNNLISELINNGLRPYATLFHWDAPQALEDEYGGFLDDKIVQDFKDYCEVCFKEFGGRVKHWITLNEPWTFSTLGYGVGLHAPGRCSEYMGCTSTSGNSLVEPYTVGHNLILAHAAAFRLYEEKFKDTQKGEVGIALNVQWYLPYSESRPDFEAANRAIDFMFGWFMEPLAFGDYPFIMKAVLRERLPDFTDNDIKMIQNSYDFIGINYYTTQYAQSTSNEPRFNMDDSYALSLGEKDGVPIGKLEGTWIYVYPDGLKDTLMEVSRRYNNPKIYVTENGTCELDDSEHPLTLGEALDDEDRKEYHSLHLAKVKEAISKGADVKGYFAWALIDNFEWSHGYTNRFGLVYIDYKNNLKRLPKESSKWFTKFLKV